VIELIDLSKTKSNNFVETDNIRSIPELTNFSFKKTTSDPNKMRKEKEFQNNIFIFSSKKLFQSSSDIELKIIYLNHFSSFLGFSPISNVFSHSLLFPTATNHNLYFIPKLFSTNQNSRRTNR